MCNLYDIGPKPSRLSKQWKQRLAEAMDQLPKVYHIRRTDPGLVGRWNAKTGEIEPAVMRWGFKRDFSNSINNARSDKLESGMWKKSWHERRCVIPVGAFYEWSGAKGAKQTHAFLSDDSETGEEVESDWLWMAGLWEPGREGDEMSYSMITTEAKGVIAPIHHRMPAILRPEAVETYLTGNAAEIDTAWLEKNAESPLQTFRCQNPLKGMSPGPPVEDLHLF